MENVFRKDVLQDIAWEKENINKQIELLEPMKKTLHRSKSMNVLSTSGYFFLQLLCWVGVVALISWLVFLFSVSPLYELSYILHNAEASQLAKAHEVSQIEWTIRLMVLALILLLIIVERQLNKLRRKSTLSAVAGRTIAEIQAKLEERMQTLLAFENKYSYLMQDDIHIELDQFDNPLDPPPPPPGDRLLD